MLVLTPTYPPDTGAASIRVSEIVKKFSEYGQIYNLKILVFNPQVKDASSVNHWIKISKNIEILRFKPIFPYSFHKLQFINPFTLLEWMIALLKIKDYHPDLIFSTAPPPHPVISGYVYSKIKKSKHLVDIRDNWSASMNEFLNTQPFFVKYPFKLWNYFLTFIFILSCKHAALISCVHEALKVKSQKLPVIIVPNGINIQELLTVKSTFDRDSVLRKFNIKFNNSTKFLIYTGDLSTPYYSPEIVLDAMQKLILSGLDIRYIILGDGIQKEKIAMLAEEKGIKENIHLLGRKTHPEVLELLLASDVAVFSQIKNDTQTQAKYAFSVKIYEYIACERPILMIANDSAIISHIITENNLGISLNWDAVERSDSLKNALLNILENYTRYSQNVSAYYKNNLTEFDRATGLNELSTEVFKILK
ncbi:Glycosyl transferases group 1 [uncultured archaeon]|nr:Glycosyl transferases group 1 [uncultured archaeon]